LVDEELAFQVVEFVLNDAGQEAIGLDGEGPAFLVEGLDRHFLGAAHLGVEAGDGHAAFLVIDQLLAGPDHLRVDEDAVLVLVGVGDEDADRPAYLGRGQAEAAIGLHGRKQALDEFSQFAVYLLHRLGHGAQQVFAECQYRHRIHKVRIPLSERQRSPDRSMTSPLCAPIFLK
jgi:hypothetical protein